MLALVTCDGCRIHDPSVTAFLPRTLLGLRQNTANIEQNVRTWSGVIRHDPTFLKGPPGGIGRCRADAPREDTRGTMAGPSPAIALLSAG